MSVVIETSIGDFVIDLYVDERPTCCKNFLKLCKIKYYNFCLFHNIQQNYIAQTGDPTGTGRGGESIFSHVYGEQARYFEMERFPLIKHKKLGTVSMINNSNDLHGSQFLITLSTNLDYLDGQHTVFGEVSKGFDTLEKLNEWICDKDGRPYQDIRIMHTVILDDPFDDFPQLSVENGRASPEPTEERLQSDRIRIDEDVDQLEGMSQEEIEKFMKQREAKTRAKLLEIIGDIPDADVKPPENVLFVCKLNPVTTDEDLELIFSRFGKINSCEVIRDKKTGDSLCYAFVEFDNPQDCENAYFKMDNVLIDDRRIHVDFSQSVAKVKWKGKGTGTGYFEGNASYNDVIKKEEQAPQRFKIENKSRRGHGYEFVFDEENNENGKYEPITERGHKHKTYENSKREYHEKKRDTKREKSRDRDRDQSKDRYREKESRDRYKDKNYDRHKEKEKDKDSYRKRDERDRDRERERDRDQRRRSRDRDSKYYDRRK